MRAALYTRISSDRDDTRLGVKRQEEDCRRLVADRGWKVEQVYCDNSISAAGKKARPKYQQMLTDIAAGRFDAVVVWDQDRLVRRPIELEEFVQTCERAGVRHLATVHGDADLGTGDGLLIARIKGAVAAEEVAKTGARIRRKHEELAKAGKLHGGGTRPFGYEVDRVTVRPAEAKLVQSAAKRIAGGASLRSVVADWNGRGITTPTGAQWRSGVLRRLLTSPRVAGLREHRGEVVGDAVWLPVVDRGTWEAVRTVLLDPRRNKHHAPARRYLLTGGVARCGLCGARLVARPRENGDRCYVCATGPNFEGCGKIRIGADPLEEYISDAVIALLASDDLAEILAAGDTTDTTEVLDEVRADEDSLKQLAQDHYADRLISRAEFLAARDAVQARLDANMRRLAEAAAPAVADLPRVEEELRQTWEQGDLEQRRSLVGLVLDRVVVNPAVRGRNFFDPDRVDLVWRA